MELGLNFNQPTARHIHYYACILPLSSLYLGRVYHICEYWISLAMLVSANQNQTLGTYCIHVFICFLVASH